ncbi:MAG: nucleotidyltransferase domain-containing protein [Candidatus Altiarchaeota archaeon]|nr:nucleotidyltransferase domain-containing protein [Candidatus Altiarchaeota archaeon]
MKITKPLNRILDSEAKIEILRFLCGTGAEWNGRQIAKEIGVTPATAHKALNSLNNEGMLILRNMGKTHVYSLNTDNIMVKDMLKPLFFKESEVLCGILKTIKKHIRKSKIKDGIISAVLFGSVNAKQDHSMSDIDVAVVVKTCKVKAKTEISFEEIDREISSKFGNTVSAYINTKAEFKSKKKANMAVIKNILKGYTLIYGKKIEGVI